jgi:hypothetical protein
VAAVAGALAVGLLAGCGQQSDSRTAVDVLNATHAWLVGWLAGLWRTTDGIHCEPCAAR